MTDETRKMQDDVTTEMGEPQAEGELTDEQLQVAAGGEYALILRGQDTQAQLPHQSDGYIWSG